MEDGKPFVRMNNHDIGGYAECTWHVVLCGLPTNITALEYPTTWPWATREGFLDGRAGAYEVARALADSLGVRLIEEFSEKDVSGALLDGVSVGVMPE